MRKLLFILTCFSFFVSCKKDGISPKDERNDCKNCTANISDLTGNTIGIVENKIDFRNLPFDYIRCSDCKDYCDYLHWLSDRPDIKVIVTCK